jgi:ribA/ribD-fused uncharacterized protein
MKTFSPRRTNSKAVNEQDKHGAKEIRFYRASEKPYGAFSNLFPRPILFDGREFPTAEHAYQAGKARKEEVREWILSAPSPSLVAMAAHGLYTWDIVPNWSQIKFDRMRAVLRAKFTQHQDLAQLLVSTGDARIVEVGHVANGVNRTWGEVNGKGLNMLGVLLMEIRAELKPGETDGHKTAKQSPNGRVNTTIGKSAAGWPDADATQA